MSRLFFHGVSMVLAAAIMVGSTACDVAAAEAEPVYDLVVYGGTSAGIMTAVQARRMGKTAVVVGPDTILGGLSSGGLGWTDSGNKAAVGGLAREFYHRVWKHYQDDAAWRWQTRDQYGNRGQGTPAVDGDQPTMWNFEPHVSQKIFEDLVRQYEIPVHRDRWLDREQGVRKDGARIVSITMLGGETFHGRIFVDATYEGDLMAAAGVSYHVGREANSVYGETLNGVQLRPPNRPECLGRTLPEAQRRPGPAGHYFAYEVSPYVVPDDPASGLLPRIHDEDPGEPGQGDHHIQAYNYRMCLTNHPDNRVPFPKPEGYDPLQYELLLRTLLAGSRHVFGKFDPIPNAKTDTNNHGPFSTDNIGMNYDYPEASYERRREILREHETYQQGYLYFLANDPRVPEDVRRHYNTWGLAADEFVDNGNWPHQIYVREARRMTSDFVVTENHLRRRLPTPRSVGMGSYNMDSHHTQRYIAYNDEGRAYAQNEGDVQINPGAPYPVDYGALVPKRDECDNLLVPVCVSSSHIAFGSIRMEPVFMILGQSAATAASMAIDGDIAVQDVDYAALRERLLADGQVLEYRRPGGAARSIDAANLAGVVVDDFQAQRTGEWETSTAVGPYVQGGYLHDSNTNKGQASVTFTASLPRPGRYEVRIAYTENPNRATNVPVTIRHAEGETRVAIDQRRQPPIDQLLIGVGTFHFDREAVVVISNEGTDGYVIADAVQLVPEE